MGGPSGAVTARSPLWLSPGAGGGGMTGAFPGLAAHEGNAGGGTCDGELYTVAL